MKRKKERGEPSQMRSLRKRADNSCFKLNQDCLTIYDVKDLTAREFTKLLKRFIRDNGQDLPRKLVIIGDSDFGILNALDISSAEMQNVTSLEFEAYDLAQYSYPNSGSDWGVFYDSLFSIFPKLEDLTFSFCDMAGVNNGRIRQDLSCLTFRSCTNLTGDILGRFVKSPSSIVDLNLQESDIDDEDLAYMRCNFKFSKEPKLSLRGCSDIANRDNLLDLYKGRGRMRLSCLDIAETELDDKVHRGR